MKKLKSRSWIKFSLLWLIFIVGCEPLVDRFDDVEDGVMYVSKQFTDSPQQIKHVRVMTWNIRFGAGRLPWFGDSCGDRVILTDNEVMTHLQGIAAKIDEILEKDE